MLMSALVNPAIWLVLIILATACVVYAWRIVRRMRHDNPDHGQTAWLVVIGVAATIIAYTCMVAIASNLINALEYGALLLLAFAVAGLPMVVEYVDDHLAQRRHAQQSSILREISQILSDEDE